METIKDLVSVIIPTYNRAHLIKRSAMSVLNQTYDNLELIIVDDGSTDNTAEVIQSIDDKRVIYIKQQNQGACAARNNGIDHAQGEFIAFQDSDDVWHEDKLEKQLKCMKETGADMVVCGCKVWKKNKYYNSHLKYKNHFLDDEKWPYAIGTQTFFANYFVFKNIRFDDNIFRWQDFEILTRIQKQYKIYCQDEILIDYYNSTQSISKSHKNLLNTLETIFIVNKSQIQLKRVFNDDLAIYIITNSLHCNDNATKKRIIDLAYKISNHILYIKLRHLLYLTHIHSLIANLIKLKNH